jgi:nicotinate-nucleotide pyrophosphorylase (carboxylating)
MPEPLDPAVYRRLVHEALAEDVGSGDRTTAAVVPAGTRATAAIVAGEACVIAGLAVARDVFAQVDAAIGVRLLCEDGQRCGAGDRVVELEGSAAGILTGERTALNFLQHLSGIATRTAEFVRAAGGALDVLDTRKTVPGLRVLAKYAVRCGGGVNHRVGLFDGILIKDNHIRAAGSAAEAVRRVRATGSSMAIEVEAETDADVDAAIAAGADVVMLDNMDDDAIRAAVRRIAGRARVELSGRITLERLRRLADSGADCVSIGAITHSAPAVDLSLDIERLFS